MAPSSPLPPAPPPPPPSGRPRRLHLFDLDGTLIHGSSAAVEISRQLGLDEEIHALELAFAAGGMTPPDFASRACALWSELTEEHVDAAFAGAPWLTGIGEVWEAIRERGDHCAVISLSPDFFVGRLLLAAPPSPGGRSGRGADATHGSRWPAVPFREPLDPDGILSAAAKVRIADELCAKFGVSRSDCVAYGDSMSDAELFGAVPLSVAVNADRHLEGLASLDYRGSDLREAYGLVGTGR
ncbi:HAD family hydrolase [Streptomyces albidus (ex Kaewkla and Franco 2022)]|uniref:HAD family hydrolase n=1 Tax=Streptomyces albidus (ex Kaewkla and Franco 2022) TaxID=722709 RepID=UPI0015EF96CA|nr:haloacid dehalogenase-like hydrolase [Streptomyces albidus (ex Kaewkla and Franco 2022)]